MTTWFISDLHLDASRPGITALLLDFLSERQGDAAALYILGDFFEYWVGDDALGTPEAAVFQPVIQTLRELSDSGVKLYFQHGNRDFLVGEGFARVTGCTLLPEQQLIDLYGTPTLLLHGDTLCTDDVEYQQMRKMLRNPQWQQQVLSLPLETRIQQAQAMRAQSRMSTEAKAASILDVNPQTVLAVMATAGVTRLIHGHTHRPAVHDVTVNGNAAQRIVLGDWHEAQLSFLRVDANGVQLVFG
jgi:UDP-2,3-diacylglucosamine hydrolase